MASNEVSDADRVGLRHGAIAGLLSGGSVLGSRAVTDLLSFLIELFDLGVSGLIIYQVSVNSGMLGIQLSWLLIGFLVYSYTPQVALGYFGDISRAKGFRIITGLAVTYYGVLLSQLMGLTPEAVALGQLPSERPLLLIFGGLAINILVLMLYVFTIRGERLASENSEHWELIESFSVESQQTTFWRMQELSRPIRTLLNTINSIAVALLFILPCVILGLVLAAINGFYPIPEGLVFIGSTVKLASMNERLKGFLPISSIPDIEFAALDEVVAANQNIKGLILTLYSILALGVCAMTFFMGVQLFGGNITQLISTVASLGGLSEVSIMASVKVMALFWFVVTLLLTPFIYGVYGMFYWYRQLRRLPDYVSFWEERKRGRARYPPSPSVSRPLGLFLPADVLFLVIGLVLWWGPNSTPRMAEIIGYTVGWIAALVLMIWSLKAAESRRPKPLDNEGRDVLVAFVLQWLAILIALILGGINIDIGLSGVFLLIILLIGLGYFPEVSLHADRSVGPFAYVDVGYLGVLFVIALWLLDIIIGTRPIFLIFVAVLMALWVLFSYLDESVDV